MDYRNQLVLTGQIDEEGAPIRQNSGNSYRLGLEVNADIRLMDKLSIRPNLALSRNKNVGFVAPWNGELVDYGDTDIAFSPEIVAGNIINYTPVNGLELKLLSKYVSDQYMSNIENENSKLDAYFVNDFNAPIHLEIGAAVFDEIVATVLVNNIFGEEYVSNGYYYTYDYEGQTYDGAGYYPQAPPITWPGSPLNSKNININCLCLSFCRQRQGERLFSCKSPGYSPDAQCGTPSLCTLLYLLSVRRLRYCIHFLRSCRWL